MLGSASEKLGVGAHFWHDLVLTLNQNAHTMNATRPALIMQRWNAVQYDVLPELRAEVGVVTPKLERLIYVLEWARIEEFADDSWDGIGRPPHVRA
ncbi:hypothetical protein F1735_33230, partial [Massilia sp. CCM 8694]|nr:hypothetical protein [Massilia genomosp. 1]